MVDSFILEENGCSLNAYVGDRDGIMHRTGMTHLYCQRKGGRFSRNMVTFKFEFLIKKPVHGVVELYTVKNENLKFLV